MYIFSSISMLDLSGISIVANHLFLGGEIYLEALVPAIATQRVFVLLITHSGTCMSVMEEV